MANQTHGNSLIIHPEGQLLWEAGETPCNAVITLDLDIVSHIRQYGSLHMDHYLQHLRDYHFPMPFAENIEAAPIFDNLPPTCQNMEQYLAAQKKINEK